MTIPRQFLKFCGLPWTIFMGSAGTATISGTNRKYAFLRCQEWHTKKLMNRIHSSILPSDETGCTLDFISQL